MKRFLGEVAAFLALQVLVAVAVETVYHRLLGAQHYLAAYRDKERLLQTTPPPRVLLVGGSNLAFGVDSAAIGRALGRPAVNLALHAGLGLEVPLRQAERSMARGDLVVLSPEYGPLSKGLPFDPSTLWQQLFIFPSAARDLHVSLVPRLLDEGLALPRQRLNALWDYGRMGRPGSVYWRDRFGPHGDFQGHLDQGSLQGLGRHVWAPGADASADACRRLKRFADRARERGVEVVIAPPPIPSDDHENQREAIAGFWHAVARGTGLPVLEDPLFPRSQFFDTEYHLTEEGRRRRTASILRGIRGAGATPGHSSPGATRP